jgi:hypothetical protein
LRGGRKARIEDKRTPSRRRRTTRRRRGRRRRRVMGRITKGWG